MRFLRFAAPKRGPAWRGPTASVVTVALIAGSAGGVGAGSGEDDLSLRYTMHFGGFHVADLQFERQVGEDDYEAGVRIRTTGLTDLFLRYDGRARAEGLVGEDPALSSTRYRYRYRSRNGDRTVKVTYDPATASATEVVSQKRGRDDAIDVPRELWRDVVDPLSAVLLLRDHVRERRAGGPRDLEISVFDGRRRYDLSARVVGETTRDDTIRVDATIRPVAGFDIDDMSEREIREGYRIELQFSDDERALPVDIRTTNTRAVVVIRLARDCALAPCTATASTTGSSRG